MTNQSAFTKPMIALSAAALSAALLWGCGNDGDMDDENMSGEVDEAVEETRETASNAAEETREAVEETGDRVESATD